jgi:glycosyltransferase involved in cell wall biosynthesis
MLVQYRQSPDPSVISFQLPAGPAIKVRRALKHRYLAWENKRLARAPGASLFSDDRSPQNADVLKQIPQSDILNLHWVAGFIDYRVFFRKISRNLPVVWTLHDMNPFTGGCHFDDGCGKFAEACGACPQLDSAEPNDPSSRSLRRKHQAFAALDARRFHLVTPSEWMKEEVEKSALFSKFRCTAISNGVDTDQFQPRNQAEARKLLNIPAESLVILFLADWAGERRKGFRLLGEALAPLSADQRIYFLTVGRELPATGLGPQTVSIDYIGDDKKLSSIYSAADVFVLPSLQDNFPNTALEALACGVPVVAFQAGGIPEIVRHGESGTLVPVNDVDGLRAAIMSLLENKELRKRMSEAARRQALASYGLEIQAKRYAELYEELAVMQRARNDR